MTEWLHFHSSLSCIEEGNGNPLQCSCLENPRDGGAWWAPVYGIAQSRTRLKWLSSSSSKSIPIHCHFSCSSRVNMNPHALRMDFPNSSFTVTVLVTAAAEKEIHEGLLYSLPLSPIPLRIPQLDPLLPKRGQRNQCPEIHHWNYTLPWTWFKWFWLSNVGRDNRKWKGAREGGVFDGDW